MQTKRVLRRIAIALVLVVAATGVSYVIRDLLAMRNPVSALPILYVQYYDTETEIPPDNTLLASYSWKFVGSKPKEWELENPQAWKELEPFLAAPGMPLNVDFSFEPKSIRISRWYGEREDEAEVLTGPLSTPYTGGTYVYRIEAEWSGRGSVQYYFKIRI